MRRLGAPSFEWFIAGNQAVMLCDLGRYSEAEELAREILGPQRAVCGTDGTVNAALPLSQVLVRTGRYEEALQLLDEILPLARQVGGTELLEPILIAQAELEEGRGNLAAARQSLSEASRLVLATPAVAHWFRTVVPAARLMTRREAEDVLERVRRYATHPGFRARVVEAEATLARDPDRFRKAAEQYGELELPYPEARCRLECGDLERAREIVDKLGLQDGPLGARLRELSGAA